MTNELAAIIASFARCGDDPCPPLP